MGLFKKKDIKEEIDDIDENESETRQIKRQFKDLNPENKKNRSEPIKPWGIKERLTILFVLLFTVLTSGLLALTARNYKLPNLPKLKIPDLQSLNPFREEVIVIGNKGFNVSQQKISNAKKLFKEATNGYSGMYSFYIYDINGDYYYGLNYQEKMQAASLIKLPVMYMAMRDNKDVSLVEAMGKRSDNSAFIKMVSLLGKENVNKTISDLGMAKTSLSENITTPEEIGIFFKKLYKNELLSAEKTSDLENYMTDTAFEKWLRPGLPDDVRLVHKYGREVHVVNDAGIVMSDKPFVIVIMTDGVIESEADMLIPDLARILYQNHISKN